MSTGRVPASRAGGTRADSVGGLAAELEVDKCLLTHYVLQMMLVFRFENADVHDVELIDYH